MISLNSIPQPAVASSNTVMPANMVNAGSPPSASLNLDEKKAEKKLAEEKKRKTIYTYLFFGVSIVALTLYSVYFFYPNLMAYLNAPDKLMHMEQERADKETSIADFEAVKSLHQSAYDEEILSKQAIVDIVFPTYEKLKIVREIENAIDTLDRLGIFETNAINVTVSEPQATGWVTYVSGNFTANQAAFDAFIDEYVGNSGNLNDPHSTIAKELTQLSIKPAEVEYVNNEGQKVKGPGVTAGVKLAYYTRPATK